MNLSMLVCMLIPSVLKLLFLHGIFRSSFLVKNYKCNLFKISFKRELNYFKFESSYIYIFAECYKPLFLLFRALNK